MLASGFTFIKNAVKLDYPVVQAIESVLPLVDEFVVNVGIDHPTTTTPGSNTSANTPNPWPILPDDGTLALMQDLAKREPKVRVIQSTWNPQMTRGAYIYAQQTNIALLNCRGKWAFYVQSDEVVHEEDHAILRETMLKHVDNPKVDALALQQINFWGDYQTTYRVRPWRGRRRCWVVKPHHFVSSRGDAAGFTVHPKYKERGRKLRAVETQARQFHYSAIKSLKALQAKYENAAEHWSERDLNVGQLTEDVYYQQVPRCFLKPFTGTHPAVMAQRIAEHPIELDLNHPNWRHQLTSKERKILFKSWLVDRTTDRFTGRGSYQLVNG